MKKFLLHPTHRKFIRLLRQHIEQGRFIIISNDDIKACHELFHRTNKSLERHKGIYKIVLNAMQRQEIHEDDRILDKSHIDFIESCLCKVERKNLFVTIRNIIILPMLQKILHYLEK